MQSFKSFLYFVSGFILCFIAVGIIPLKPLPPIDIIKITEDSAATMSYLATVAIAALTFLIAGEAKASRLTQNYQVEAVRKEGIRPFIEIFIEQSKSNFQVFNIRVENVGKGVAQNISFVLTEKEEDLSESQEYLLKKLKKLNFFKNGIKILGSGKARSSFLFTTHELYKEFDEKAFEACLSFKVISHDREDFEYTTTSIIDLSEFEGISQVGEDPIQGLYKELKNISAQIGKVVDGKKLSVKVFQQTKEERKIKREADRQIYQHLNLSTNRVSKYIKSKLSR